MASTTNAACIRLIRCALAITTALLFGQAYSAEYQYSYPVTGSSAQELVEQIKNNSASPEGAFGYTNLKTHVGWTAIVDAKGVCSIESVEFSYDISIHMPQWLEKHTAKQCLQDNWDSVWYEILVHEQQHRDLYRLLNVENVEQRISAILPRESCLALEIAVNDEVEKILDANDKLHDMFHQASTPPTLWDC